MWSAVSKDVIRNSQIGSKIPTLDMVNHRLNIFKAKIEKVDYLDILTKDNNNQNNKDKSNGNKEHSPTHNKAQSPRAKHDNANSIKLPEDELENEEDDLI